MYQGRGITATRHVTISDQGKIFITVNWTLDGRENIAKKTEFTNNIGGVDKSESSNVNITKNGNPSVRRPADGIAGSIFGAPREQERLGCREEHRQDPRRDWGKFRG